MSADPDKQPPRGKLGVTTPQQIVTAVLSGAAVGYLLLITLDIFNQVPPLVPWTLPIFLAVASVPAFLYARKLPARIEKNLVAPDEGVRALLLGKSMLMTGAVLAGGHLVYVLKWIALTDIPGPRDRVIQGSVTIVAAILFAVVGGLLERACIVDVGDGEGSQPA